MSWTMPTNNFKCFKSISRMIEERRENQSRDNYSELSGPLDILFKPQAITINHVLSADYFRLWPVSVKAWTSMRYSSRQLEKLQQKQEQFYPVPWVPEVFFFLSFVSFSLWFMMVWRSQPRKKIPERCRTLTSTIYFIVHVVTLRTELWQ